MTRESYVTTIGFEGEMTIDWSACTEVETVPGKAGGLPVVRGTRVPAETILVDEELGATAEETHDSFPTVSLETILKIRAWAHSQTHQLQP